MLQAKFSVKESQARFLSKYKDYGFKDKSTMLRLAIDFFERPLLRVGLISTLVAIFAFLALQAVIGTT